jgi:hypothetical protein
MSANVSCQNEQKMTGAADMPMLKYGSATGT